MLSLDSFWRRTCGQIKVRYHTFLPLIFFNLALVYSIVGAPCFGCWFVPVFASGPPPPPPPPPMNPLNPAYPPGYSLAPPYSSYPAPPVSMYPAYPSAPAPGVPPYPIQYPPVMKPPAMGNGVCPGPMPYSALPHHPYPMAPCGYPGVPPPGVFRSPYPHSPKWGHHKGHHYGMNNPATGTLTGGLMTMGMGLVGYKANKKLRKKMKKAHKGHKHWHHMYGKVGLFFNCVIVVLVWHNNGMKIL